MQGKWKTPYFQDNQKNKYFLLFVNLVTLGKFFKFSKTWYPHDEGIIMVPTHCHRVGGSAQCLAQSKLFLYIIIIGLLLSLLYAYLKPHTPACSQPHWK